jgi:hypothetical protein
MRGLEPAYTSLAKQTEFSESELARIYGRMPGGNNSKTTSFDRFDELDGLTVREIEARFPPHHCVSVHDIAASNAITSVQLFHRIAAVRPVTMKASDFYDAVLRVRVFGLDFIFDAVGEPLQLALGRIGMRARRSPWRLLGAPLWPFARRAIHTAQRISLFHPTAAKLARETTAFRLAREDLFDLGPECFQVVRVTNAIGPWLPRAKMIAAYQRIASTICENGLLVAGRRGDYGVFLRSATRYSTLATLGPGIEVAFIESIEL